MRRRLELLLEGLETVGTKDSDWDIALVRHEIIELVKQERYDQLCPGDPSEENIQDDLDFLNELQVR